MAYDPTADALFRQANAAKDLIAELRSDDETLNHDMVEGETSFLEAIDRALAEIDNCDVIVEGCKAKEQQMAERRRKAEARQERVRGLIEQAMVVVGMDTVKRPTATLSVAKVNPKPIITDEAAIPAIYWKQADPVLDKTALNKDAKDGAEIPGVTMSNGGVSLKIRRL